MIGLAIAGGDAINALKQAAEFGVVKGGQNVAGLLLWASDVAALGLPITQGVVLTALESRPNRSLQPPKLDNRHFRDYPVTGHAADMPKSTRMTQSGHGVV